MFLHNPANLNKNKLDVNTIKSEKWELFKINMFGDKVYCPNCALSNTSAKMKAVSILLPNQTMTGLSSICYHCKRCGGYMHSPIEDFMGIHVDEDEDNVIDDKYGDIDAELSGMSDIDLDYGSKFRDNIY